MVATLNEFAPIKRLLPDQAMQKIAHDSGVVTPSALRFSSQAIPM